MTDLGDVHRLRQELQKLHEQKVEVNDRLNSWNGGRGRGRGMPMHDRSRVPPGGSRRDDHGQEAARGPAGSRPRPFDGPQSSRFSERRPQAERAQATPSVSTTSDAPKKLMSAIVINGQAKMLQQQGSPAEFPEPEQKPLSEGPGTAKRPALSEAERAPDAAKRARRMFGNLLGTLARASAEEKKFQDTGAGAKRQTAMQRVREREREQRQQARQEAIAREKALRQAEILRKRELSAMEDVKRSEITAAEALRHQATLSNFIRTVSRPPLHWLPALATPSTEALLEREQERLSVWKAEAVEKLEIERRKILAARAPQLLPQDDEEAEEEGEDAANGDGVVGPEDGEVDAAGAAIKGNADEGQAGSDRWQAPAGAPEDDRWQQAEMEGGEAAACSKDSITPKPPVGSHQADALAEETVLHVQRGSQQKTAVESPERVSSQPQHSDEVEAIGTADAASSETAVADETAVTATGSEQLRQQSPNANNPSGSANDDSSPSSSASPQASSQVAGLPKDMQ